ncbi:MAG: NfeD family protein, partial [Micromonosporaceae bacterium]
LMLATGALAAAGTGVLTDSLVIQVLVFAGVSTLTVGFVRPFLKKRMLRRRHHSGPLSVAEIEGSSAVVLERVDTDGGLVNVQGDHWTARPFDETQVMEPGDRVKVVQVKGATALVWKDV